MGLRRALPLLSCAAALLAAGPAAAAAPRELTIQVPDGTQLACALVEPDGPAPARGWPALLLFHGLGGSHRDLEPAATDVFAPAGYASLMCDARGEGDSGGQFGLDGRADVRDTRQLFDWLAGQPEISNTKIGAFGLSLGGGAVWNAAAAGVPFRAIVPAIAWTSLRTALAPQGLVESGLVSALAQLVPTDRWDPGLRAAKDALLAGTDPAALARISAPRSVLSRLPKLSVPTLMIQGRHDFLFDLDQALDAYRRLRGPKALYLGDLGHPPASSPDAEKAVYLRAAVAWFDRYVKRLRSAPRLPAVTLAHDPWDGKTTTYSGLPPTRTIVASLPGRATIRSGGSVVRRIRPTGGPHETFGGATVRVAYADASGWDRLVAVLSLDGSPVPLSAGGVRLTGESGVAEIRLLDESVLVPRGARLVLTLGATSLVQSPLDPLYALGVPAGASITLGRATLTLPVLKRAVSG